MILLRLLRLPNLLMVLATLGVPYWFALRPAILKAGGIPVLSERSFGLLAAATVLTTLAGYWINDYYDVEIDAINKGEKRRVTGRFLGPNGLPLFLFGGYHWGICFEYGAFFGLVNSRHGMAFVGFSGGFRIVVFVCLAN